MKLHLPLKFSVLLSLLFLITGCAKEDAFKNPADVVFNIGMNPQGTAPSDDLTFSDGYVILNRFTVIGERAVGENFEFSRTFPNGLKIPFYNNLTFEDLSFELPQGTYTSLKIRFETASSSSLPGVFVEGNYDYNNPLKPSSTVHLAWNAAKTFDVAVLSRTGSNEFVLDETQKEFPKIVFQPKRWFENVTELMLENASFVTSPSQQIMRIDPVTNVTIFTALDSEIGLELICTL